MLQDRIEFGDEHVRVRRLVQDQPGLPGIHRALGCHFWLPPASTRRDHGKQPRRVPHAGCRAGSSASEPACPFPARILRGMVMYLFGCEAVLEADPDAVWKVWTDVAGWPAWDVSKEIAQLDGPFEPGARGWAKQRGNLGGPFTITAVDP